MPQSLEPRPDPTCKTNGGINGNGYTEYNTYAFGSTNSYIVEPSVYCATRVATDFADKSPRVPRDHSGCKIPRPSGHNRIVLQNYNTLIHNIGHYFGLAHTFPGASDLLASPHAMVSWFSGPPRISPRSIDVFDGDGPKGPELAYGYHWSFEVTDTAPEAGTALFLANDVNPCNSAATPALVTDEAGTMLTFSGDFYVLAGLTQPPAPVEPLSLSFHPDRHNVMSYFLCKYPMELTPSQIAAMRSSALKDPNYQNLICQNPDNSPLLSFVSCP